MLNACCRRISLRDFFRRLIGADVLLDVQRDNVRVLMAAQIVLRDLRAGAPSITYETGGAGGGRLMRNIAITRTTRTTTTRIVMVVITASYSSPFAPAQLTSAA